MTTEVLTFDQIDTDHLNGFWGIVGGVVGVAVAGGAGYAVGALIVT